MKSKRHKGHGSGTLIASLQALLSKANSSKISQSLMSLLTDSAQFNLGLSLLLFTLSTRFSTGASECLRWTCSNHLSRCWVSFSSIGATPNLSRITSFRTLSLLVCPQNHRNIRIFATQLLDMSPFCRPTFSTV